MTEKPIEQHKTRIGDAYRANVSKDVSADGTLSLQIENPTDSGTRLIITAIKITVTGQFELRVPRRFDDTQGSAVIIENKNIGSTKISAANAYKDSTYTNADDVETEYLGSGQGANAFGGQDTDVTGTVLQESSLIIELENLDSSARNASITVEYYETSPSN